MSAPLLTHAFIEREAFIVEFTNKREKRAMGRRLWANGYVFLSEPPKYKHEHPQSIAIVSMPEKRYRCRKIKRLDFLLRGRQLI